MIRCGLCGIAIDPALVEEQREDMERELKDRFPDSDKKDCSIVCGDCARLVDDYLAKMN
jgi:hypothetical protein